MELALEITPPPTWVIDTETTGIGPLHRIVEIGGVELVDRRPTGRSFQFYINPQRKVDPEAFGVHGLSDAFLSDKPLFTEVIAKVLGYVKGAVVVAHNASFDVGFLDRELQLNGYSALETYIDRVEDTLKIARKRFPGKKNNLDALCRRFKIDITSRKLHGALLDSEILSKVYLLLTQSQGAMQLVSDEEVVEITFNPADHPALVVQRASTEELVAHAKWLAKLDETCEEGAAPWGRSD